MMKKTPFYDEHVAMNAQMVDYAGWSMPVSFKGLAHEHLAVRESCGIFDVSHMGEIFVTGTNATQFLDLIMTNRVESMHDFQVKYSLMCYENGCVVDDVLIYRYHAKKYLIVVNAANIEKDLTWLNKHKMDGVTIQDYSSSFIEFAIQGPKAEEMLNGHLDYDVSGLEFFHFDNDIDYESDLLLISRTGYTGEDGFEVYGHGEGIKKLYRALIEAGVEPCGLGARDTLRFESRLPLYGNEISESITPLEAGLSYFVDMDKDFIGREALQGERKRKIIGLEVAKGIARHGYDVLLNDEIIGHITTGYQSPSLGRSIANAIVYKDAVKLGDHVEVQIRKRRVDAEVVKSRFRQSNYKK